MTVVSLYFVLSTLQLLHGTEEYLTGWSQRSVALYRWYRRFLPFVPPDGMSVAFHVLLNFGLGALFLAAALFVAQGQPWALAFARLVAVLQIVHTLSVHLLGWAVFRPYFPGAITATIMLVVSVLLLFSA
jgi:hypothetical protein